MCVSAPVRGAAVQADVMPRGSALLVRGKNAENEGGVVNIPPDERVLKVCTATCQRLLQFTAAGGNTPV